MEGDNGNGTDTALWAAVANPLGPGTTGDRYFLSNQAGQIYFTGPAGGPLTAPNADTLTPPTGYVAASLMLFSTVATLFWYVLQLLMSLRRE